MNHCNPGLKWFVYTKGKYFQYYTNEAEHVLQRGSWSFVQTEQVSQYCQPMILVDDTFLTRQYRGMFMMAFVVDPEDQIVPIVFALVEGENLDSWSWFMWLLWVHVLGLSRRICL